MNVTVEVASSLMVRICALWELVEKLVALLLLCVIESWVDLNSFLDGQLLDTVLQFVSWVGISLVYL